MAINTRFFPCLGAGVLALTTQQLFADLPPRPGYVEKCTLERQQGSGEQCRICGASFQGRDDCTRLAAEGFEHRCRAYGASVWKELWCRAEPEYGTQEQQ